MYINCKTWYSLRYGTFSTEQLIQAAIECGVSSLALTNFNATTDSWEFVRLCSKAGIKPILGVEVRNGDQFLYILLAANGNGLAWIHGFLSEHITSGKPFPEPQTAPSFFAHPSDGFVIYAIDGKSLNQ